MAERAPKPKPGMYTAATMERNLTQGNIGEAMFRFWCERNATLFEHVRVIQVGYNPLGIVSVADKPWLSQKSDPDFALAKASVGGKAEAILYGISVNAQQTPYFIQSTSGGFCGIDITAERPEDRRQHCPLLFDCHDRIPELGRLWYNRPNIDNDYPQFQERSGCADTILVTLVSRHPARVATWLKEVQKVDSALHGRITAAIWHFLKSGSDDPPDVDTLKLFLQRLEFGARNSKPLLTDFGIRWFFWSDITARRIPSWLTGGLSNNGRPPMKYCVPEKMARREADLISLIADRSSTAGAQRPLD